MQQQTYNYTDKKYYNLKIHFTHKLKIKRLYLEGFTHDELAIMYKVPPYVIKGITRHLKQPERI